MNDEKNSKREETSGAAEVVSIPLLPLRDQLVFPSTVFPLFVGREKSKNALKAAQDGNNQILLAAQTKAKINDPNPDEIYEVGTIANIMHMYPLPDGTIRVMAEGVSRARITHYEENEDFYQVKAEIIEDVESDSVENEALIRTVKMAFDNYARLNKQVPPEMISSIPPIEDEAKLSDSLIPLLKNLKLQDKQRLLEEPNPKIRLEELYGFIQSEIEIMRVEKKIRARVKRQMEKTQKEYYLNEQMQAIQKELGDRDDGRQELYEIENQIKTKKLSAEAKQKLEKELKKLKLMSPMSAEATVVRNYIDTVLSLPWGEQTDQIHDIVYAEKVLDRDHYGLRKVKDRILEYLSVSAVVDEMKGPILCLVGPPGVGKTSLARSVAESTGREFIRIALGGVRDEADIRGHRRTYIGSMPGKIIMALKKAGSSNPVVLLDEIDKISQDFRGDPTSALLEVLDPNQNHTFNDHYLDLDYDISKVLFMATANGLDTIPGPLRDRMEIIQLSGYTELEKVKIATQYLIPKQVKDNGFKDGGITWREKAIREIIQYYTREAGVRNLEREIGAVCRKIARKHLTKIDKKFHVEEDKKEKQTKSDIPKPIKSSKKKIEGTRQAMLEVTDTVTAKSINNLLGPRRHRVGLQSTENQVGICTGLAWTQVGGDLLMVEVAVLPGKGNLKITGQLGEVMQESAQAALSYVRSRSEFLGLEEDFYAKLDIHIHVPEGAIPKDGPSAGLCITSALTSAFTGRPVNKDVAMTGEINLRGNALPIGGLKEKVLAAHRGGIKKVLIPMDNEKDVQDIPPSVLKEIEIIPVSHVDEVLLHTLVWDEETDKKSKNDKLFSRLQEVTNSNNKESGVQHAS